MYGSEPNIDPNEITHFDGHAVDWWDKQGPLKALHDINPMRLQYIQARTRIKGKACLDVGCGGGILSESLAQAGADVTAIDMTSSALQVARDHLKKSNLRIDYRQATVEDHATESVCQYDIVTCMELLEHVPQPISVLKACGKLLKPDGDIFIATINRTWMAYIMVILGAEYLLKIVRKGTHAYHKFIRPAEMAHWSRDCGLKVADLSGFIYNPFTGKANVSAFTGMNYLMHLTRR